MVVVKKRKLYKHVIFTDILMFEECFMLLQGRRGVILEQCGFISA